MRQLGEGVFGEGNCRRRFLSCIRWCSGQESQGSGSSFRYIDEDQLVVNMKKVDGELKWPDTVESWESLTEGMLQLLKGVSIYIVGDSTEINRKVSWELAVGLGCENTLWTRHLFHNLIQLIVICSHVRTVVSTLGGKHGAAGRADKWRHLYSGFTVWVSQTEATDEETAKQEARRNKQEREIGYSNADVVVSHDTDQEAIGIGAGGDPCFIII